MREGKKERKKGRLDKLKEGRMSREKKEGKEG